MNSHYTLYRSLTLMALAMTNCLSVPGVGRAQASNILSSSEARLPMSLSMIISDLEVEGCLELTTACLITSKGVSQQKQKEILGRIVGGTLPEEETKPKVVGTSNGLVLCSPSEPSEVALTACACDGTIVYCPDPVDISRSEGLFNNLAPAMEKLVAKQSLARKKATLIVGYENDSELEATKSVLERESQSVVSHLISNQPLSVWQDVFEQVKYVQLDQVNSEILSSGRSKNPVDAAAKVAETVDLETMFAISSPTAASKSISAQDLAAARKLGPRARSQVTQSVRTVETMCTTESGEPRFVPDFGAVCFLAVQQAQEILYKEAGDSPFWKARVAQQIRSTMVDEIDVEFSQLLEIQLDMLSSDCFDKFRKNLSKLLVGPNLGADMKGVMKQSLKSFTKQARQLVAKQATWTYIPSLRQLEKKFGDFVSSRLEAAQASGQYRPLPRKGVTVGMHWLLPKPFGNDYRQEPYMVHAVDTLTYVPPGKKLSDVNQNDVASGDWRKKIVPSPTGNDMVYLP